MAAAFLHERGKAALLEAVRAVEGVSAVEVMVAVRRRSAGYPQVPLGVGIAVGVATLGFMMWAPLVFSHLAIVVEPVVAGALAGFLAAWLPGVRRWLTSGRQRREQVEKAAKATFFDKRVRHTSGRTGVLVYISLLERELEVVADTGVVEAVGVAAWEEAKRPLRQCVRAGGDAVAVARELAALAELFAEALPREADDRNELPDEVSE